MGSDREGTARADVLDVEHIRFNFIGTFCVRAERHVELPLAREVFNRNRGVLVPCQVDSTALRAERHVSHEALAARNPGAAIEFDGCGACSGDWDLIADGDFFVLARTGIFIFKGHERRVAENRTRLGRIEFVVVVYLPFEDLAFSKRQIDCAAVAGVDIAVDLNDGRAVCAAERNLAFSDGRALSVNSAAAGNNRALDADRLIAVGAERNGRAANGAQGDGCDVDRACIVFIFYAVFAVAAVVAL